MPLLAFVLAAGLLLGRAPGLAAQAAAGPEPGSELSVFLLTMGAGDHVWEHFGHNALWVRDHRLGTDIAYNYGMFDFGQPGFVRRFVMGRMWYWMDGFDVDATLYSYLLADRSVWAQELNLTPAQRQSVREYLAWNARPENRFYRYDYYRDNCSTRIRDLLDAALDGRIRAQTATVPAGETYRTHTRRVVQSDPLLYTGIDLGLGAEMDRGITRWEEMFLPVQMMEQFRGLTIIDGEGREAPLVLREETLHASRTRSEHSSPPRWEWRYLLAGVLVGVVVLGLGQLTWRRPGARWPLALVVAVWMGAVGAAGSLLLFLWAVTDHEAAYRNENLFHANPLALAVAVLVPLLLVGTRPASGAGRTARAAVGLAAVVAALSLLGVLIKALPWFPQQNLQFAWLLLPAHLAVAAVAFLAWRARVGRDAGMHPAAGPTAGAQADRARRRR
jgi:hypothetical protein